MTGAKRQRTTLLSGSMSRNLRSVSQQLSGLPTSTNQSSPPSTTPSTGSLPMVSLGVPNQSSPPSTTPSTTPSTGSLPMVSLGAPTLPSSRPSSSNPPLSLVAATLPTSSHPSSSSLPLILGSSATNLVTTSPASETSSLGTHSTETVDIGRTSTHKQPFITEEFPRVVDRVPLPPTEDLLTSDGKKIIRLSQAKDRFMGSRDAARFFRREFGKDGFDFYPTFTKVPDITKDAWWESFQGEFYWGPHTDKQGRKWPGYTNDVMKKAWRKIGSDRYSNAIADAKRAWGKGKKPNWITQELFDRFIARWETDEVKAVSEQNRKNRMNGPFGMARQTVGSIPSEEHLERLQTAAPPGVIVDHTDLFQYTHKKSLPATANRTLDSGWVDDMSKHTFMEYTSQVSTLESQPNSECDQASKSNFLGSLWKESVKKVGGSVKRKDKLYGYRLSTPDLVTSSVASTVSTTMSRGPEHMSKEEALEILKIPAFREAMKEMIAEMRDEQNGSGNVEGSTPSAGDSTAHHI